MFLFLLLEVFTFASQLFIKFLSFFQFLRILMLHTNKVSLIPSKSLIKEVNNAHMISQQISTVLTHTKLKILQNSTVCFTRKWDDQR